jgi:hypothetical protein
MDKCLNVIYCMFNCMFTTIIIRHTCTYSLRLQGQIYTHCTVLLYCIFLFYIFSDLCTVGYQVAREGAHRRINVGLCHEMV